MRETRKQLSVFEVIPDTEMVMSSRWTLITDMKTENRLFHRLTQM